MFKNSHRVATPCCRLLLVIAAMLGMNVAAVAQPNLPSPRHFFVIYHNGHFLAHNAAGTTLGDATLFVNRLVPQQHLIVFAPRPTNSS